MDWPLAQGCIYRTAGTVAATSSGTVVTAGASSHTKGSWQTLDSSIPSGVSRFWLLSHATSGTRWLIDIGIGSTPTVLVSNLYGCKRVDNAGHFFAIPLTLPPGEALKARAQCQSASETIALSVVYEIGGQLVRPPLGHAETCGAETSNTSGITIDPGGTAHTKGAYGVLAASTAKDIRSLLLCFGGAEEQETPPNRPVGAWLFDISVGGSGVEKIIIPNLGLSTNGSGDTINRDIYGPFEVAIPAGTRLTARCQCSLTDSTERLLDLVMIGFC